MTSQGLHVTPKIGKGTRITKVESSSSSSNTTKKNHETVVTDKNTVLKTKTIPSSSSRIIGGGTGYNMQSNEVDDDGEGWITSENLPQLKASSCCFVDLSNIRTYVRIDLLIEITIFKFLKK